MTLSILKFWNYSTVPKTLDALLKAYAQLHKIIVSSIVLIRRTRTCVGGCGALSCGDARACPLAWVQLILTLKKHLYIPPNAITIYLPTPQLFLRINTDFSLIS